MVLFLVFSKLSFFLQIWEGREFIVKSYHWVGKGKGETRCAQVCDALGTAPLAIWRPLWKMGP